MRKRSEAKSDVLIITLVWCAGMAAAAQFGKVAVALDAFRGIYEMGEVALGILISCVGGVGLVFGVFGGVLITGFGIRRALIWALLLGGGLSVLQSSLPPYPVMMALRLAEGATHLAIVIAGPILMARHSSDTARPAVMTLWSSFFGLSYMLIALVAPGVLAWAGVPGLFVAHSAVMFALALALWVVLPAGPPSRKSASTEPVIPLTLPHILRLHLRIYRSPTTSAAGLGFVFYTGLYIALLSYLPGFVEAARRAPMAASLPLASIVISLTLGVFLLRRVPPVRAVQIGFLLTALMSVPLLITQGYDSLFILACLLLMGATGFIPGASFATLAELNPTEEGRAHATGALAQMGNVGTTCGPPVLAAIISVSGLVGTVFFILMSCGMGFAVHTYLAYRRTLAVA